MADKIALVGLRKTAETGDQREAELAAENAQVQVEVVKGGKQVRGVQAWGDGVLHVVRLALVRVREEAHVALEAAVANQGLDAGALSGVVGVGRADGRVAGFDVGDDGCGVRREGVGDEGGEVSVGHDSGGHEEVGFIEDVREDERV